MHLNTDLNNELEEANKNNGNFNLFETKEKEITIMEDNDLSKNSLIYSELNNDKYNAKNKDINLIRILKFVNNSYILIII